MEAAHLQSARLKKWWALFAAVPRPAPIADWFSAIILRQRRKQRHYSLWQNGSGRARKGGVSAAADREQQRCWRQLSFEGGRAAGGQPRS